MRLDPIVICPYDPSWPESFIRQRDQIAPLLAGWITRDIEHMGSTAVPGLAAKPIIDMLAVVDDIHAKPATDLLDSVGWVHAPEPFDEAERKLSFCYPSIAQRTHHLHVAERSSADWRDWLAFRDYLRSHEGTVVAYADLKTRLADVHGHDPNDRDAYRHGKAAFIQAITEQALHEGLPRAD
ncbi:MAG: GrpB family protein [Acidimicrobiia bacterium]